MKTFDIILKIIEVMVVFCCGAFAFAVGGLAMTGFDPKQLDQMLIFWIYNTVVLACMIFALLKIWKSYNSQK